MDRAALGWVLALVCGSAAADWTPVGGDGTIFAAYADPASVKPSADGVQMLGLYDFLMADVSADGQPHESTVVLREYDCRGRRVRLLAYVDYAGHMGAGRVISPAGGHGPGRWEIIVPGALDEFFLGVACAQTR
ncbi:MAG: surface-adhesin E family protein [Betaproteobacteria bacterium]